MYRRNPGSDGLLRSASESGRVRAGTFGGVHPSKDIPSIRRLDSALAVPPSALLHAAGPLSRPACESAGGLVRRLSAAAILVFIAVAAATIFGQELGLVGRYDDARYLKQSTADTNQIVFARLIFNG